MDSEVSKPVDTRSVIGNLHSYAPPSRRSSFDTCETRAEVPSIPVVFL